MLNFPICLAAHFCLAFRMGGGDNSAKVLHFSEIRGMDTIFSLGKACGGLEFVGLITSYCRPSSRI